MKYLLEKLIYLNIRKVSFSIFQCEHYFYSFLHLSAMNRKKLSTAVFKIFIEIIIFWFEIHIKSRPVICVCMIMFVLILQMRLNKQTQRMDWKFFSKNIAQSAGAVEYTDCTSAKRGKTPLPMNVLMWH